MFAIIKTGGKQYRVTENDVLKVEKLEHADNKVVFDEVLLIADGEDKVTIGQPMIKGAKVEAQVLADGKSKKVMVIKYKAKVRYKRTHGHRQNFTQVKIGKITA